MKSRVCCCLFLVAFLVVTAQQGFVHKPTSQDKYVWPQDTAVLAKLEQWQDLKFGILFHYGLYSVPGIVESWSICSEDVDWINRPHLEKSYPEYKEWYNSLADSLQPTEFNPRRWVDAVEAAGAKYAIVTTKHHDGFCLYDSQFTDFTLPAHGGPDVVKAFLDACKDEGIMTGAYFSKPDWHCPYFWNPQFSTPDRHENYNRERHPQWWKEYVNYTQHQLNELTSGEHGKIDILWLDGGWVTGDEVGLDTVLTAARVGAPGLICVDRSIGGKNENYQTPERGIPAETLFHPWESCIPLSDDWGWVKNPNWKSPQKVINLLAQTVSHGGNLLLGVGPNAQGEIETDVTTRLEEIGNWLYKNGEAIYNTRPLENTPQSTTDLYFTHNPANDTFYAIFAPLEKTKNRTLSWNGLIPEGEMTMVGNGKVKYENKNGQITIKIPRNAPQQFALRFKAKPSENPEDSLKFKIGQLCCMQGWEMYQGTEPSQNFVKLIDSIPVGGLWATLRADPWTRKTLTNGLNTVKAPQAIQNLSQHYTSSLNIPLMIAEECTHGHMAIGQTVFPTGLCQASTFNPSLIQEMGQAIAREALSVGATVGYGPIIDVARDPRWSRMEESYGEDPELVARMAVAYIKGMQGEELPATMKHFAAYGIPSGGHNGGDVNLGPNMLKELLYPARQAVKEGKVASVMTSYNKIDGVPATAHRSLLTDTLRQGWGFDGVVISDLFAINGLCGNGYCSDCTQAAAAAINAGVDMDLGGYVYSQFLPQAVHEGLVSQASVDSAYSRVLKLKNKTRNSSRIKPDRKAHQELASQIAQEGTVLLENDGILPLNPKKLRKIAVLGPNAHAMYNQLGDYTAPQPSNSVVTPLDGIKNYVGKDVEVAYERGGGIRQPVTQDSVWERVDECLEGADVSIVVVGGSSARDFKTDYLLTGAATTTASKEKELPDIDCGEGMDRATLSLLGSQEELLRRVNDTGIPMIVVYIQGRPLDMNYASQEANALLTQWYPGTRGGEALAKIIFGQVNPSGKLPVSVPRNVGQLPIYYSQPQQQDYVDSPATPLYPFGYGLSYSTFVYDKPRSLNGEVAVKITNTGEVDGQEVVQLYRLLNGRKHLVDFKKTLIPAHKSTEVVFPHHEGTLLLGPNSSELHALGSEG